MNAFSNPIAATYLLLMLLAPMASASAQDRQDEGTPLLHRSVRWPLLGPLGHPTSIDLVPYARTGIEDWRMVVEPRDALSAKDIAKLLNQVMSNIGFEDAATDFWVEADEAGVLQVDASAAAMPEFEKLLDYCIDAMLVEQRLLVATYPILRIGAELDHCGGLGDSPATQRIIADLQSASILGAPSTQVIKNRMGRWSRYGGQRTTNFVRDLDVEGSQSAGQADPWLDTYRTGTVAHLRSTSSPDGAWIQLLFERNSILGEVKTRSITSLRELYTEHGKLVRTSNEFATEQPTIGFATLACSAFVPRGQELILIAGTTSPSGSIGQLIHIAPSIEDLSLPLLEFGDSAFAIRDVSTLVASHYRLNGGVGACLLVPDWYGDEDNLGQMSEDRIYEPALNSDWLLAALQAGDESVGLQIEVVCGMLFLHGSKVRLEQALALIATLESAIQHTHGITFEVRDRSGSKLLAELSLVIRDDKEAIFSLGADALALRDYDVEVSSGAMMCDPVINGVAHGILGKLRATQIHERVLIDMQLGIHWMNAEIRSTQIPAWEGSRFDLYDGLLQRLQEQPVLRAGESWNSGDLDPEGPEGLVIHLKLHGT